MTLLVVGDGRMASLAESIAVCAGEEMCIERCTTLFQAGLKMANQRIHVVVVDAGENGLQETVQTIRTLEDRTVMLAVREAGVASMVKGIDEYFTHDATPELIVTRAHQLSKKTIGLMN